MSEPRFLSHDWFPTPLPSNVVIGARSWLHSTFAFLHYRSRRPWGLRIGHDTGIYIGTLFDLGPDGEMEIGDYCAIVGLIVCSNARVVIGDYAFIAHEVVIADSPFAVPACGRGDKGWSRRAAPGTSVVIGENVWIGARAVLLRGARVGDGAIIGAAAVVDFEVPPYAVVAGNPAHIVGWARPREQAQ